MSRSTSSAQAAQRLIEDLKQGAVRVRGSMHTVELADHLDPEVFSGPLIFRGIVYDSDEAEEE